MSNAYIETTILADILLKPGSKKQAKAKAALARYDSTLLPVYSIKEWKAGILDRYAYFHDKLVETGSVSNTLDAINSLHPVYKYRLKTTSFEAFQAAAYLVESE